MGISACTKKEEEVTYLYTYEVTKDNYKTFFDVKHENKTVDDVKTIETTFSLLDENDLAEDIKIEMTVTLYQPFVGYYSPTTKNYTINFNHEISYVHKMTYGITQAFEKAEITSFEGMIKTNTKQDFASIPTDDESDANYEKLMEDLEALDTYTSLTMNALIKVKQNNQTSFTRMNIIIDSEDFYIESLVNNDTGYIVKEIDGYYYMYELFRYEYKNYIRLAAIYEEPLDDWYESSSTTEFDKSWEYTYYDGIYTVKASFMSLFEIALGDDELLDELISEIPDEDLIMTIDLTEENAITMTLTFEIEGVEMTIDMTYVPDVSERIDLSYYTELPVLHPNLLTDYTDLTEIQEDHVFDGINSNYYAVNLEVGTYSIDLPDLLGITIYDSTGQEVFLTENSNYAFQDYYQQIYDLDAGEYIIEISSYANQPIVYDFQMANLTDLYDTIVDMNNPEVITTGIYQLDIEGDKDIVVATFNAPDGGMLVLKPNVRFEGIMEIIPPSGNFNHYTLVQNQNDYYLHLDKGTTTFIFLNREESEQVTFEVNHYGVTQTSVLPLPSNYPNDYIISTSTNGMRYSFTLTEESVMHFESEIDPNAPYASYGISYTIDKMNGAIPQQYASFSMTNHYQVYLPAGTYQLRAMGVTSVKVKGYAQSSTALADITIEPDTVTDLSTFDLDPLSYMKSYYHYPSKALNIHFTLDEMKDILIAFYMDLEYELVDENNTRINYDQLNGHQVFRLPAGSYQIKLPVNPTGQIYEYKVAVSIVTDNLVQTDDFIYNYKDPVLLDFDTIYQLDKEYKADHEVFCFEVTETKTLDIVIGQMAFVVIYNGQTWIKSMYDTTTITFQPGTYTVVFMYMSSSNIGTKIDFMLRTVS